MFEPVTFDGSWFLSRLPGAKNGPTELLRKRTMTTLRSAQKFRQFSKWTTFATTLYYNDTHDSVKWLHFCRVSLQAFKIHLVGNKFRFTVQKLIQSKPALGHIFVTLTGLSYLKTIKLLKKISLRTWKTKSFDVFLGYSTRIQSTVNFDQFGFLRAENR